MAEIVFKQNYCHACHVRFAVHFPLPSLYVSSLLSAVTKSFQEWSISSSFIRKAAEKIIALLHQKLFMATAVVNCAGKVAFPGHLYLKKKSLDTIRTSGSQSMCGPLGKMSNDNILP